MLVHIDTLYSLDDVASQYAFDTETMSVINTDTQKEKKVSVNKRGYPVVYLQRKPGSGKKREARNVPMHKIVALAMINNGPYILIEHIDDNKMNYAPENLLFSNPESNIRRMYANGIQNHKEGKYVLETISGEVIVGTMKHISSVTKIPRATLYDRYYFKRANSKHNIKSIKLA